MKMLIRELLQNVIIVAALVILCTFCRSGSAQALEAGDLAKDFALRDGTGKIVTLSDIRSDAQISVVEMINIYCEACREMTEPINKLAADYGPRGVKFVAIALANTREEVDTMARGWNAACPVLADPDKTIYHLYGAMRVPQFFVIDNKGVIRYRGNIRKSEKLAKILDELLQTVHKTLDPGDDAPGFALMNQFGDTIAVNFKRRNQNTILGFFSGDDQANRDQARALAREYDKFREIGLRVYGILPGSFSGNLKTFIRDNGITFPVLKDQDKDIFSKYTVANAPELIVVSESGRIRQRVQGLSYEALLELFATAEPPAAEADKNKEAGAFLKAMLPEVHTFKPLDIGPETVFLGMDGDGRIFVARFVRKDILCDVCANVHFAHTLDEKGIIRHIALVVPFELYGKPIDASPFIKQFIGHRYDEIFIPGKNVDIISGATKSCSKFIEGLNETKHILGVLLQDELYEKKFTAEVCYLEQNELELALNQARSRGADMSALGMQDLVALCPGKKIPECPSHGVYTIGDFNGIPRVGCSVHGLDPQSSVIH